MRSGRRPSPEDKVAVCWCDPSYDMCRYWNNIKTSQEERRRVRRQEEGRDKELTTNENEQSHVQLVGRGRRSQHKENSEDSGRRIKGLGEKKLNKIGIRRKNSKGLHTYKNKVTQPTQNGRVRGGDHRLGRE